MFRFRHPFSMIIAGPTMCGKSKFVSKLLATQWSIIPAPRKVCWFYGVENIKQQQKLERTSLYDIAFYQGIPSLDVLEPDTLVILDDLMSDVSKSIDIAQLFTRGVHHKNISVILIVQNLFHQGKKSRDISLNTNYFVLFKNPRDSSQINTLARQIFPYRKGYLQDAFQKATSEAHGYLLIDLTQKTSENLRLMSNILPPHVFHYHVPENKN